MSTFTSELTTPLRRQSSSSLFWVYPFGQPLWQSSSGYAVIPREQELEMPRAHHGIAQAFRHSLIAEVIPFWEPCGISSVSIPCHFLQAMPPSTPDGPPTRPVCS